MNAIEQLLRKDIGLDPSSVGITTIDRAVRLRMKANSLAKTSDYVELLQSSRTEREELVEAVVVAETWFFRERDSFGAFMQLAQQWFQQNPVGTLRILSIPCSSGEEPYSLALTLLDAMVPPGRFAIDGVDISARAIALAIRGVYGRNSFRGGNLAFRNRHFRQTRDGYALDPAVKECVRFHQENLFNPAFLTGHEPYHLIFCRNLLIYFDRATQTRALTSLCPKLAPNGLLFVSPAEMSILLDHGFAKTHLPAAFAGCKTKNGIIAPPRRTERAPRRTSIPGSQPPSASRTVMTAAVATSAPESDQPSLETARKLADAGQFQQAAALCEIHLHQQGPSAQAFYLLGLVHDATGDARAADYYRKALYLDPNHHEALWHMALLMKKNGADTESRAFKRRAEKTQKKT